MESSKFYHLRQKRFDNETQFSDNPALLRRFFDDVVNAYLAATL